MVNETRTSYPIPDGYRMLEPEEIIQAGDKAWAYLLSKFVDVAGLNPLVGKKAKRANCAIRYDEDYLIENIERRSKNGNRTK